MKLLAVLLVVLVALDALWVVYTIHALERENTSLRECLRGCSPCERYVP